MLQNNPALKSKIDHFWDKFWGGEIADLLTAMVKLTFYAGHI
jgi:hypothetical protein